MQDLEGNLEVFEPVAVLQMVNLARVTGKLRIARAGNTATVFFERGNITFAELTNRTWKLGEYLVSHGHLDQKTLDRFLRDMLAWKKLGERLVEAGAVRPEAIREAVGAQIREVIYELVRWEDGRFLFVKGERPKDEDVLLDVPLDELMMEGLRRMDEGVRP